MSLSFISTPYPSLLIRAASSPSSLYYSYLLLPPYLCGLCSIIAYPLSCIRIYISHSCSSYRREDHHRRFFSLHQLVVSRSLAIVSLSFLVSSPQSLKLHPSPLIIVKLSFFVALSTQAQFSSVLYLSQVSLVGLSPWLPLCLSLAQLPECWNSPSLLHNWSTPTPHLLLLVPVAIPPIL